MLGQWKAWKSVVPIPTMALFLTTMMLNKSELLFFSQHETETNVLVLYVTKIKFRNLDNPSPKKARKITSRTKVAMHIHRSNKWTWRISGGGAAGVLTWKVASLLRIGFLNFAEHTFMSSVCCELIINSDMAFSQRHRSPFHTLAWKMALRGSTLVNKWSHLQETPDNCVWEE